MASPPAALDDGQVLHLLSSVWQLNRRMKADMLPLLKPYELDMRLYAVLLLISKAPLNPGALAAHLDLPASMLSRYLDALVRLNYIERRSDPGDARRTLLTLTPSGKEVLDSILEDVKRITGKRLEVLEPERLRAVLDAFELLASLYPELPPIPGLKETNIKATNIKATQKVTKENL